MAVTVAEVRTHLGQDPATTVDEEALAQAVAAANALLLRFWPEYAEVDPWPGDIQEGTILQAARNYARRGSTQGIAAYADVGVTLLARLDPDVRLNWRLGEYQDSVVA